MPLTIKHQKDIIVASFVEFNRDLDREELKKNLSECFEQGNRKFIVDLSTLKEIPGSAFWSILITYKKKCDSVTGGAFIVAGVGNGFDEIVKAMQLDKVLNITTTVQDAMDLISAMPKQD